MKRLTFLVSGNVQKAGYRDIIIRLGNALGLKGYAENLPDGRAKVVAEGEEKKLELLKESADIKNTLINVETIESSFSEATDEFSRFSKLVSEGETDARLDRAAELLKELIEVNRSGFGSLKADTSAMLDKQDLQLEISKNGFNDMRKGFADLKEEMRTGFADVKEEIHMQRDDFREVFIHEVTELRSEIAEIKATLARMQAAG